MYTYYFVQCTVHAHLCIPSGDAGRTGCGESCDAVAAAELSPLNWNTPAATASGTCAHLQWRARW